MAKLVAAACDGVGTSIHFQLVLSTSGDATSPPAEPCWYKVSICLGGAAADNCDEHRLETQQWFRVRVLTSHSMPLRLPLPLVCTARVGAW
eukprot:SAG11_NODE_540_length_8654_cov_9.626110_10_plen_91_part_00